MKTWVKAILALAAVVVIIAVPVYVVASLAFARQTHQERYITTVRSSIDHPTGYVDVPLDFAYYYKKDESRLRVVVSLPDGYPVTAGVSVDSIEFNADHVLPEWACRLDPRSTGNPFASINGCGTGIFAQPNYGEDDNMAASTMCLTNDPIKVGFWSLGLPPGGFTLTNDVWLGSSFCIHFNNTWCFDTAVGELVLRLELGADLTTWDGKYDAAAM